MTRQRRAPRSTLVSTGVLLNRVRQADARLFVNWDSTPLFLSGAGREGKMLPSIFPTVET